MILLDACIQILYQVRNGTALHRCIPLEGDSLAGGWIEDREVTDVGMVTTLLRTNVWIILILYVSLVLSDERGRMTVDVVLLRTSTVVLQLREGCRHLQLHTITEQVGHLSFLIGCHLLSNSYFTL